MNFFLNFFLFCSKKKTTFKSKRHKAESTGCLTKWAAALKTFPDLWETFQPVWKRNYPPHTNEKKSCLKSVSSAKRGRRKCPYLWNMPKSDASFPSWWKAWSSEGLLLPTSGRHFNLSVQVGLMAKIPSSAQPAHLAVSQTVMKTAASVRRLTESFKTFCW